MRSREEFEDVRDGAAYSYLLGMYLGDGCLARFPRAYALRIVLDSRYPRIIEECVAAVRLVVPGNAVSVIPHRVDNSVRIQAYSQRWPCLFPQHGPGRKHLRAIVLTDWQLALTEAYPERLIRGLILFCEHLDQLGIAWRWSNDHTISVARREAVRRLDAFVGPKT